MRAVNTLHHAEVNLMIFICGWLLAFVLSGITTEASRIVCAQQIVWDLLYHTWKKHSLESAVQYDGNYPVGFFQQRGVMLCYTPPTPPPQINGCVASYIMSTKTCKYVLFASCVCCPGGDPSDASALFLLYYWILLLHSLVMDCTGASLCFPL